MIIFISHIIDVIDAVAMIIITVVVVIIIIIFVMVKRMTHRKTDVEEKNETGKNSLNQMEKRDIDEERDEEEEVKEEGGVTHDVYGNDR